MNATFSATQVVMLIKVSVLKRLCKEKTWISKSANVTCKKLIFSAVTYCTLIASSSISDDDYVVSSFNMSFSVCTIFWYKLKRGFHGTTPTKKKGERKSSWNAFFARLFILLYAFCSRGPSIFRACVCKLWMMDLLMCWAMTGYSYTTRKLTSLHCIQYYACYLDNSETDEKNN